jgi:hypothetical protein
MAEQIITFNSINPIQYCLVQVPLRLCPCSGSASLSDDIERDAFFTAGAGA